MSVLRNDALEMLNAEVKRSGVKNRWIAQKMGISEQYVSLILNGRRKLTADKAIAIAKALGVDYRIFLK
ncbi:hypothetical protein lacNasYZ03_11300 [Lactobacillus nasalidis]|uniref:HTH cro/C1-type domain-containing protein n=1 Tax=Lactobacillus nasalidis TaxID=2797258 RepID=A0ABQ3W4J5_9LACO|nr:helix-turn-helix domain-containing protein [Lactobacillus nasalidis]GHV97853.1 hypothetical protein lacNasYZ01_10350 [Lactobacillus nasalidis]GHW00083.1 hypothetical protein lacNasYZ02_15120 [Lactobacillus nasalidis]GHW01443.1 hypothetical protein lacNasYZ03_11300 [Lactobacillus nasalidis]